MGDNDHWLWRLSAHAWLDSANHEIAQASDHLGLRRTAVTHARRAAGMALNAVLVAMSTRGWSREHCETVWGRSYIDHLRALAASPDADESRGPFDTQMFDQCRSLLSISVMPPTGLVRLAARKDEAASEAITTATAITRACASVIGS
jgi:hypothetical protein